MTTLRRDEPLGNLDAKLRVELRSEIRTLQQQLGVTALYVTHDQEEALSVSDRIMVMNQGRIEQISTSWDLYNRPQTRFVASFVGTSNILPATRVDNCMRIADAFEMPGAAVPGEAFWLVVRPECIAIGPAMAAAPVGTLSGQVESIAMLGSTMRISTRIAGGTEILVDVSHGGAIPKLGVGETVSLRLDPSKLVYIPR